MTFINPAVSKNKVKFFNSSIKGGTSFEIKNARVLIEWEDADGEDQEKTFTSKPSAKELEEFKGVDPETIFESFIGDVTYSGTFTFKVSRGSSKLLEVETERTYHLFRDSMSSSDLYTDDYSKRTKLEKSGKLIDEIFTSLEKLKKGDTSIVFDKNHDLFTGDFVKCDVKSWKIIKVL